MTGPARRSGPGANHREFYRRSYAEEVGKILRQMTLIGKAEPGEWTMEIRLQPGRGDDDA